MPDIFVAARDRIKKKNQPVIEKTKRIARRNINNDRSGLGPRYRTVAERLSKQRKIGKLKAFNVLPGRVRFETQEVREKVILLLRQHWITQVGKLMSVLLMMVAPICLIWIPILDFMPGNYQFIILVIWYLLVIAFIYETFISWFFHVFIITDERVIDIDFFNLLYKQVSETKIDNIEDVTYRPAGGLRVWFNYGDVSIQTAAEKSRFMIESVPQPDRVAKILNELKLEEEHEKILGRVR